MGIRPLVFIPTYNEEKYVKGVILKSLKRVKDVLVVDDGSTDNTVREVRNTKAHLIVFKENKGKGEALKAGFKYGLKHGYDVIVTIDGDGQHDANEITKLLDQIERGSDIVIGTRKKRHSPMPLHRRFSNMFSSVVISMLVFKKIKDTQSGYRAIKLNVVKDMDFVSSRYDLESEILIKAARNGFSIANEYVNTIYHDEESSIHPVKDVFRFFRVLYRGLFKW